MTDTEVHEPEADLRVHPSQEQKATGEQIYNALKEFDGNLSKVARELGITRKRLVERIDASPALSSLRGDLREDIVDNAEDNIFGDVRRGDSAASRFVVSTIGKGRGWSQGVTGEKGGAIEVVIRTGLEKAQDE